MVKHVPISGDCGTGTCTIVLTEGATFYSGISLGDSLTSVSHCGINAFGIQATNDGCTALPIWYPAGDSVTFSIITGSSLGHLIAPNGTLANSVKVLLSSPDATGKVRFIADGQQPQPGSQTVVIQAQVRSIAQTISFNVTSTSPPTPWKITIVSHSPWSIWPSLPNTNSNNLPGYKPARSFTVKLTDACGGPIASQAVTIRSKYIALSGGHNHTNSLSWPIQGQFRKGITVNNPLPLTTDVNGQDTCRYTASQIAGSYIIKAFLDADTTIADTVGMTIEVPGLVDFTHTATNMWNFTGAIGNTTMHACPQTQILHPSNHFILSLLDDTFQAILVRFFQWSGTALGGGSFLKLGLNDMSLPNAGLFDGCNTWAPPHNAHRKGTSIDVDSLSAELFDNPNHYVPLQSSQIRQLLTFARARIPGAHRANEGPVHIEFPSH